MVSVIATFRGQDGSLGYRNGREYHLIVKKNTIQVYNSEAHPELVNGGKCPYGSVQAFLNNWYNFKS